MKHGKHMDRPRGSVRPKQSTIWSPQCFCGSMQSQVTLTTSSINYSKIVGVYSFINRVIVGGLSLLKQDKRFFLYFP